MRHTYRSSFELDNVVQEAFYVIFGVSGVLCSSIILLTISLNRSLYRKPYALMAALAVADIITDIGLFSLGINRLRILVSSRREEQNNHQLEPLSNWQCVMKLPMLLSIVGPQMAVLVIFLMAGDRLLNALSSLRGYEGRHAKRYLILVVMSFIFGLASYGSSFYAVSVSGRSDWLLSPICSFSDTFPEDMLTFYFVTQSTIGWMSVIVVCSAMCFGRFTAVDTSDRGAGDGNGGDGIVVDGTERIREMHEITRTVASSIAVSFVLWFLPASALALGYATDADHSDLSAFAPYLWMLIELRSTLNMFIYFWQDKALRDGAQVQLCSEQAPGVGGNVEQANRRWSRDWQTWRRVSKGRKSSRQAGRGGGSRAIGGVGGRPISAETRQGGDGDKEEENRRTHSETTRLNQNSAVVAYDQLLLVDDNDDQF